MLVNLTSVLLNIQPRQRLIVLHKKHCRYAVTPTRKDFDLGKRGWLEFKDQKEAIEFASKNLDYKLVYCSFCTE